MGFRQFNTLISFQVFTYSSKPIHIMNNYVKEQISGSINKFHRLTRSKEPVDLAAVYLLGQKVFFLQKQLLSPSNVHIMLQQWSPQHVTKEYKFMVRRETTFNNKILKIARAMQTFSPGQLTPTI